MCMLRTCTSVFVSARHCHLWLHSASISSVNANPLIHPGYHKDKTPPPYRVQNVASNSQIHTRMMSFFFSSSINVLVYKIIQKMWKMLSIISQKPQRFLLLVCYFYSNSPHHNHKSQSSKLFNLGSWSQQSFLLENFGLCENSSIGTGKFLMIGWNLELLTINCDLLSRWSTLGGGLVGWPPLGRLPTVPNVLHFYTQVMALNGVPES